MNQKFHFQFLLGLCFLFLASTLSSCGEDFTGTFTGDGQLLEDTCSYKPSGAYHLSLLVTISGNDVDLAITQMAQKDTGIDIGSMQIEGIHVRTSIQSSGNGVDNFYTDNQGFSNALGNQSVVIGTGSINDVRDQIFNYQFQYSGPHTINNMPPYTQCQIRVQANNLVLQQ